MNHERVATTVTKMHNVMHRICMATGKLKYFSPQEVERRRKTIKRRRDERLSSFRCDRCRCWHLGHRAH